MTAMIMKSEFYHYVTDRAQRTIEDFFYKKPGARIAVIPDGPYTLLQQ